MSEREFWLAVRRALLTICAAIEQRYLARHTRQGIDAPPEKNAPRIESVIDKGQAML